MGQHTWEEVDRYFSGILRLDDAALQHALERSDTARLPAIAVSAPQGKLLNMLARLCAARRILEIGTLAGYSGIWLARALPADGKLVTLELDPKHPEVARDNFAQAGLASQVEVRVGPAIETLPQLAGGAPFDFTFIDADKASTPQYLDWAIRLSRPGALIVIDNVVRNGSVLLGTTGDASVQGVRRAIEMLGSDPRLDATAVQTVGCKGYDGFALAVVR
jgi:predicted O-methyltransferase YrrM